MLFRKIFQSYFSKSIPEFILETDIPECNASSAGGSWAVPILTRPIQARQMFSEEKVVGRFASDLVRRQLSRARRRRKRLSFRLSLQMPLFMESQTSLCSIISGSPCEGWGGGGRVAENAEISHRVWKRRQLRQGSMRMRTESFPTQQIVRIFKLDFIEVSCWSISNHRRMWRDYFWSPWQFLRGNWLATHFSRNFPNSFLGFDILIGSIY